MLYLLKKKIFFFFFCRRDAFDFFLWGRAVPRLWHVELWWVSFWNKPCRPYFPPPLLTREPRQPQFFESSFHLLLCLCTHVFDDTWWPHKQKIKSPDETIAALSTTLKVRRFRWTLSIPALYLFILAATLSITAWKLKNHSQKITVAEP